MAPEVIPLRSNPEPSDERPKKKKFSPALAWSPVLARTRYVAVVHGFLDHYASLKPYSLTIGEAMFVVHLMRYKWGEDSPFPGYKTLAKQMGVSDKMVRRYAKSLEAKGFLKRELRQANTNRFDLTPLFQALERRVGKFQPGADLITVAA
jgi:DNA-binding MarR family transcriptional regulator